MTSTVVEHATIEAKMVSAENLTVNMVREDRVAGPELDWYPKAFFRAMYIPDSLLDEWVAPATCARRRRLMRSSLRAFCACPTCARSSSRWPT